MMNRALKTLLVWLLVAVLPLHAVAGSLGMSCAPVHQQSGHAAMNSGSAHHDPVADEHAHHNAEHAVEGLDPGVHDHPSASKVEKQSHSSCSACSAFCIGAVAPPSAYLPVPTFDGTDAVAVPPAAFAVGFIQDGPQRPPRHHSA
jgi:hypothetical protein